MSKKEIKNTEEVFDSQKKSRDGFLSSIKDDKSFVIKEKHNINANEAFSLTEGKPVSKEILIPVSVFQFKELSALEAICKYLKEELEFNYSKTALMLNRDSRTIWTTYKNAAGKRKERLPLKDSRFFIPINALKNRKLSVLESIISYLKENFNLKYSEIAALLNRDERNVWTAYSRYKKKNA
ncbi:sigma-70 region 4 domain-containing protein [Candidatus Woesearchaeota archaeon]|nr:sigma-70 region 4 domain-containing protein [Candidatus Woesearchaeota archaeon]